MSLDITTAVCVGDGAAVLLLATLFFSNLTRINDDEDLRMLYKLLIIVLLGAVADWFSHVFDGHPGTIFTVLLYVSKSYVYFANIVAGVLWVKYVAFHLKVRLHRVHVMALKVVTVVGCLLIVVNLFVPIIFSITDNVYERGMLYKIYTLIAALCLLDSVLIYLRVKKSGGMLKFFPIAVFLVPAIVGITFQFFIYGISTIWISLAISIAGIMTATQNEIIYIDRLTGIYNRSYLDHLQKMIQSRRAFLISGIMIDLNDFKSINDSLGHAVGDDALINTARIFSDVVGEKGSAIRYAGDEFVLLLNTADTNIVENIILQIKDALEEYNASAEKPYKLSASMGFAVFDFKQHSIAAFMNIMDERMYEEKARYYREHGEADRRRNR